MFITWEEAKRKYPDSWVAYKDPQYKDKYHMEFFGGEFVGIADDYKSAKNLLPNLDDSHIYTILPSFEEDIKYAPFAFVLDDDIVQDDDNSITIEELFPDK